LRFSQKRQDRSAPNFFQGLGENTCLLQRTKSNAPGLQGSLWFCIFCCKVCFRLANAHITMLWKENDATT